MADPFQPRFVDLVRNLTTTQGTGNFELGSAATGFTGFETAVAAGESFYYSVIGVDKPTEREVGRGTMQPDGTISRAAVSGSLTNFTAGNKTIALIAAAEWFNLIQSASLSGGSGGGSIGAATRTALAGQASQLSPLILTEAGREGIFAFDSSNLSAKVTADPRQAIYVAPTTAPTGASGAWVRKFSGPVNVKWFGATGDGTTNDGPAFAAAIALLKATAVNADPFYKGSQKLFIPAGLYNLATTTLDITHVLIIEGESSVNGYSSRLKWGESTTGIRIQDYNTSGATTTDGATHFAGSYTTIRNLGLIGPVVGSAAGLVGGEAEYHGIHVRSNVIIEDVFIDGFRGDGVHAKTEIGAATFEGNSNCSRINRLWVQNVRNGVFLDGADANAWVLIGVNGTYCRQHTVWDSSFLGNTHIGHHSSNAGIVPGVPASVVSYNGNLYSLVQGQAAGASTNAPSGTTADNQWWYHLAAGEPFALFNIPLWTSGVSVREGGGYRVDTITGRNVFIGCYQEGGEGFSQFKSPTVVMGGLLSAKTTGNSYDGDRLVAPNDVQLGQTRVASSVAANVFNVHNNAVLAAGTMVTSRLSQGYEADGVTPFHLGSVKAFPSTSSTATAYGTIVWSTRGAGGTLTEQIALDGGPSPSIYPYVNNTLNFGVPSLRWKKVHAVEGDFSGALTASNLSGSNTGDQTITLTGDVTGSGSGSFAATIGANKVTFAKFVAAAGASIVGATAAGNFSELTPASARSVLGLATVATSGSASDLTTGTIAVAQTPAFSGGDVTKASGSGTLTIGNGTVTYAKLQNVSATALLLGRATAGAGVVEELSLANGLAISGTALGLGAITPSSLVTGGAITSSGTAGNGYSTGAGGAVTQATSKSTAVTLNKICGRVTMNAASLAASTSVSFTLTNSTIAATDVVLVNIASAGATNAYVIGVDAVAAGSCRIHLRNLSAGALAEALVLNFAVTKSVIA